MKENSKEKPEEKFLNKEEYSTLYVKKDEEAEPKVNSRTDITRLIELLTNPLHRNMKEEILIILKTQKNTDALMDAILENKDPGKRHLLIAACWEADLDCSEHLLFFTGLAIQDEYLPSLEAITVIENMRGEIKKEVVEQALKKVKEAIPLANAEKKLLLQELEATLERFKS